MVQKQNETPKERAPVLLVFGDLAPRVASLIRARPVLLARLVFAPREAVHAIAAFLYLGPDAARPDAEVATTLDETDPRDLLRAALPGCPARLYRALDRAGDEVRERRYYERLGALVRGPFGEALLDGGALGDARLEFFEALSAVDPLVAGLRGALPEEGYAAEALGSVAAYLRARGGAADRDLLLPPRAGMKAVVRCLQRALDGLRAPPPGFVPPPPLRLVGTVADLRRIGAEFENCVRDYSQFGTNHWFDLAEGRTVFLVGDDPPLLAALRSAGSGLWLLEQVAGPKNGALSSGVRRRVLDGLRAAGARVVPQDPSRALGTLASYAERSRGREDEAADEPDGELGGTAA